MSDKSSSFVNPSGLIYAGFSVFYAAFVPVSTYLSAPGGVVQSATETIIKYAIPGVVKNREIPALAALYIFAVWPVTGSLSVAGAAIAQRGMYDNKHPRQHTGQLRGISLRLKSAHTNLLEGFPAFAVAAALVQLLAPKNQLLINLLGLHVVLKTLVYYPLYLLNIDLPRSLSYLLSVSSLFNVCWQLAKGA